MKYIKVNMDIIEKLELIEQRGFLDEMSKEQMGNIVKRIQVLFDILKSEKKDPWKIVKSQHKSFTKLKNVSGDKLGDLLHTLDQRLIQKILMRLEREATA